MKVLLSIIGTVLIIFGILGFTYKYFYFTTNEKIAEVGNVKLTATNQNVVFISPLVSAILLGGGIIVLIVAASRKIK